MAVEFTLTDEELLTADLTSLTAGLTTVEKVEWCYMFTHRAANFQGKLVRAYQLDNLPWIGEDIPVPQEAKAAWKANINTLANLIVTCQNYIDGVTE